MAVYSYHRNVDWLCSGIWRMGNTGMDIPRVVHTYNSQVKFHISGLNIYEGSIRCLYYLVGP